MERTWVSPGKIGWRLLTRINALTFVALAACSPGADLPPLPEYHEGAYRLGAYDQVRIITFSVDQLSQTFRINDAGDLALPLLGPVHAAGLTTAELSSRVVRQLERKKLLRDASVSVEIIEYRPIFILGEVNKPGQYPYLPGMTVLTAVAVAGGFTYRAVQDYAAVVRTNEASSAIGRANPQSLIAPGDVIKILEQRF